MPLVKLRRAGQITLPVELREQFALEEGAYLEAEAVRDGILMNYPAASCEVSNPHWRTAMAPPVWRGRCSHILWMPCMAGMWTLE
jgi:AbrB family looped-hinge helix DNA binding protein